MVLLGKMIWVCMTCYKSHLVIIKHNASTLKIKQFRDKMPHLSTVKTTEKLVFYTINATAIQVGEILLNQDAALPPDVYNMLNDKVDEVAQFCEINIDATTRISKAMLRNHLSATLGSHWLTVAVQRSMVLSCTISEVILSLLSIELLAGKDTKNLQRISKKN